VPDPAAIGLGVLAASGVLVLAALAVVLVRVLRVRRRALALRATIAGARLEVTGALALLDEQRAKTDALLVPWRRLRRWARHPLVVAALDWNGRQRRRRRERARG
jgi:hypothetical protein